MAHRKFSSHIKSVIHFDFPYFNEPGDGLTDELGLFTLSRSGNAKLVGSEAPADAIMAGTPLWGYRCLHTDGNTSYVQGTGNYTISQSGSCEFSMWVRPTASTQGNILQLLNGSTVIFTAIITSSMKITCSSSALGLNLTSEHALALNTWTFIRFQFSPEKFAVNIGGQETIAEDLTSANLSLTAIRLGGLTGQIDEFILRDNLSNSIPKAPVQGRIDITELGGFGTGALGSVTLASDCVISSCAYFAAAYPSGLNKYTVNCITAGKFGGFKTGDEVMILTPATGAYEFNSVADYSNNTVTLTKSLSQTPSWNSTMLIQVPHFSSLTINQAATITPPKRATNLAGGIVAFRVKGDCTVNGKIITHGYGLPRTDMLQMTHAKLIDNFLCGSGGGVFITCGGTFTAGVNARIGATWSGAGKGGTAVLRSEGGNGGAGYGGAGGSDIDNGGLGGNGGVGGGGGGGNEKNATAAGVGGATGGKSGLSQGQGGTQGITAGGRSPDAFRDSGGGGAGGDSGRSTNLNCPGVFAGANIILLAKTLNCDEAAISTGGQGGKFNAEASGGAGTGFCYIACEEMKS